MNLGISSQINTWKRIKNQRIAAAAGVTLAVSALGFAGFAGSAEASGPSPTPSGYCGAKNMLNSDAMAGFFADPPFGPMVHNATQNTNGNDGMFNAVAVSACS